ncbi:MAG: helix-turn-helix domain-containing protein [Niabella sp.]
MSVVIFQNIPAHPLLKQYIECYTYKRINPDTPWKPVKKIVPPNHLTSLDFFFEAPFKTTNLDTGKEIPYKTTAVRGCRLSTKYAIEYSEPFSTFSLKFTPTGLYSLLGISMNKVTDADIPCNELPFLFDIEYMHHCMKSCNDITEHINIIEQKLIEVLSKKANTARLTAHIKAAAKKQPQGFHLSVRQQQRLFLEEIGLSPKAYNCLKRFSRLLRAIKHEEKVIWTKIAYEFGYFDQAHLIKDFHAFLGISPRQFNADSYAI